MKKLIVGAVVVAGLLGGCQSSEESQVTTQDIQRLEQHTIRATQEIHSLQKQLMDMRKMGGYKVVEQGTDGVTLSNGTESVWLTTEDVERFQVDLSRNVNVVTDVEGDIVSVKN